MITSLEILTIFTYPLHVRTCKSYADRLVERRRYAHVFVVGPENFEKWMEGLVLIHRSPGFYWN